MNKHNSPFIIILPNIIAAILFFAGALRFNSRFDKLGAIIYLIAGLFFIAVSYINLKKLKKTE